MEITVPWPSPTKISQRPRNHNSGIRILGTAQKHWNLKQTISPSKSVWSAGSPRVSSRCRLSPQLPLENLYREMSGIEPGNFGMQSKCSASELQPLCKRNLKWPRRKKISSLTEMVSTRGTTTTITHGQEKLQW